MTRSVQDVALSIKRVQSRHHRTLDAALTSLGLSLVQWDALRHLDRNPDASLHDLAQLTFQSDQAFGTLTQRLTDRGLVERVPGPGRAVRLVMTDRGRDALIRAAGVVDGVLAESFAGLTPRQVDQLGELVERLLR
ncbi:DNA-binding transcriptional regulator, MarR family [Klenkia soli]|uniref:DNA-binding transcriptional regulator, MarR family n=1 Tax=Klenkia soli TaxID=1052260 RepID=A0A1H0SLJ2_9ACTN|nr:MarR family transcriptional regulator [Klenkia soli]SDP42108.1 DNA-binding transcriptional regulator, MarR family [Klenkia soli]